MTKDQANELKVGIVVLVCLGLGLGVALKLSNWQQWFEQKNTLTFKVPYEAGIGGIKPGWPVTIGGVTVGSVQEIRLQREEIDPQDVAEESQIKQEQSQENEEQKEQSPQQESENSGMKTYSYFKFTVPRKYELREDCKLTPTSQLIGGAGELQISDLGKGNLLQDGQTVFRKNLGGSSMAVIMDTMQAAMINIRKITEDLKDVSGKARETVNSAKPQMETIISNIQAASTDLKDISGKARETMNSAKPQLETIISNVQTVSTDLKDISGKARETVNLSKPQLETIISNIRAASTEMKEGMREIRWNPWRLLHDPSDRELRTQNLLTAARAFSSGASDVDAAVGRLEGLLKACGDNPINDDAEIKQMVEELRATMVKFSEAADTFFERLGKGK